MKIRVLIIMVLVLFVFSGTAQAGWIRDYKTWKLRRDHDRAVEWAMDTITDIKVCSTGKELTEEEFKEWYNRIYKMNREAIINYMNQTLLPQKDRVCGRE